jgi:GcrA cell cycle regulator
MTERLAPELRICFPWTEAEDDLMVKLADEGFGPAAISRRMYRTPSAVQSRGVKKKVRFKKRGPGTLRPFDDSENEAMRRLAAEGYTLSSTASKMRRCARTVRKQAEALGIVFKPVASHVKRWGDGRLDEAKRMWLSGIPGSAIAKKLGHGLTRSSVIARMHREGCKRPESLQSRKKNGKAAAQRRYKTLKQPYNPKPPTPLVVKPRKPMNNNPSGFRFQMKDIRHHYNFTAKGPWLPPTPANDTARISHAELARQHCRWPVGDPAATGSHIPLFCGATRERGLPYCADHCARAYNQISDAPLQSYGE